MMNQNKKVIELKKIAKSFDGDQILKGIDLDIHEKISRHFKENYSFIATYRDKELSFVLSRVTDDVLSKDIATILIVTDITKEKLIERQKSDFFANASHELKTPITVMQGFAEVLMNKEGMDETSKKQLGRIYKECLRLGSLISDMLMLSKIESGEAPIRALSEVALEDIAKEVLDGLSEKAQSRNITAKIVGSAKICADQTMIFELVENLVSNAIKYNNPGGSVTIHAENNRLVVSDTGIGIPAEHKDRIFERFYRVDKSHSKASGGTGLGLSIVKHAAAYHKAEITLESTPGKGTAITIQF